MRPLPEEATNPKGPWPERILPIHCPECCLPLLIHRPNEPSPSWLVGTCVGCQANRRPEHYVIEWMADGTES